MSDNAEILRELIHWCPDVVGTHPTRKEDAYRALDALVAERDEEERRAIENGRMAQSNWDRAEAAEAEVARLGLLLAETEGERVGWKDRAEAAEAEVKRLRAVIEAKNELLVAYRIGSHAKADRALAKLERLVGEQP